MDKKQLEELAFNINAAIEGHPMSHDIRNPTYSKVYYKIFKDEIINKNLCSSDGFMDELDPLIHKDDLQADEQIENFKMTWDAWVILYREIERHNDILSFRVV